MGNTARNSFVIGILLAVASAAPLLLSIWLTPDANPIGFGLLFFFITPLGALIAAVGAFLWLRDMLR